MTRNNFIPGSFRPFLRWHSTEEIEKSGKGVKGVEARRLWRYLGCLLSIVSSLPKLAMLPNGLLGTNVGFHWWSISIISVIFVPNTQSLEFMARTRTTLVVKGMCGSRLEQWFDYELAGCLSFAPLFRNPLMPWACREGAKWVWIAYEGYNSRSL